MLVRCSRISRCSKADCVFEKAKREKQGATSVLVHRAQHFERVPCVCPPLCTEPKVGMCAVCQSFVYIKRSEQDSSTGLNTIHQQVSTEHINRSEQNTSTGTKGEISVRIRASFEHWVIRPLGHAAGVRRWGTDTPVPAAGVRALKPSHHILRLFC